MTLQVQTAHYTDHVGHGNLYVLRKEALAASGHELLSLADDLNTDCVTRFKVQNAWLAGLFGSQSRLDPTAIAAQIVAPSSAFSAFASESGLKSTDDLFPPVSTDKILDQFLRLPRIKFEMPKPGWSVYLRSLEIPEYQNSYVKHLRPHTTLYSKIWLSDVTKSEDEIWVRVPEETFYGHVDEDRAMPRLTELIRANDVTNIESEGLICLPTVEEVRVMKRASR